MYWLIGILVIFIVAFVIIKLSIDTGKNPDSNLGILDHPSTYEKDDIEMVDESLTKGNEKENLDDNLAKWDD